MKKRSILALALTGVLALGLMSCGTSKDKAGSTDDKTIKIGVSPVPHKEIVEQIVPELEAKGYKVDIVEFTDYVLPNTSLQSGELDANYFQHIAYLNSFNKEHGTDITYTAEIHLEPMAAFSKKFKKVDEVTDGAKVAVPSDSTNEARALRVLANAGLIKVKDGDLITVNDITENKKNLKFVELEAAQLPRALDEVDVAVINGNYALEAGLDSSKDAIAVEDKNADSIKERRNVLAVKKGTEDSQKIKDLTEALTSEKVKKFIEEKYHGAVVPVF